MIYKYENTGESFSNPFMLRSIDKQILRVKNNKASLIIIDGGVGEGKTTLAVHLVDYINRKHKLPEMDMEKNCQYSFGGIDFQEKLRLCYENKLPVIVYDEAGDFNKRRTMSKLNDLLNRTFETFRAFKIIVIIVLPDFYALDNSLFDKKIPRLFLHCFGRTNSKGNVFAFSLYRMLYIRHNMSKIVMKPYALKMTRANFVSCFKNLTPERCKALDKLSTKNKIEALKKNEISTEGLQEIKTIANLLGRSYQAVAQKIKRLNIKPVKKIGKQRFYRPEIYDIVAESYDHGTEAE